MCKIGVKKKAKGERRGICYEAFFLLTAKCKFSSPSSSDSENLQIQKLEC